MPGRYRPEADQLDGTELVTVIQEGHEREVPIDTLVLRAPSGAMDSTVLTQYVQPADAGNLNVTAEREISEGMRTITLPEGEFEWPEPADYVNGLQVVGAKEMKTSGVTGTKIHAPNGFWKNDNTTRKQLILRNLHIIGDGTGVGVDGPFGGVIEGCKIEGYDTLVRNLSGYLCFYRRNSFADASFGIQTADANGTVIEQNHFNADVTVQVSTRDGTPQTGNNSGLPLVIRENNFNAADTVTHCLKVRGQLDIRGNYFEKFNGGAVETRFIDLEVNRFDHQGAIIESNELNGQSANATALYINGSHAGLDNPSEGRFTCNRVIGCNQSNAVVYGENNRIPGFKVHGNFGTGVVNSYRTQHIAPEEEWTTVTLSSNFQTSANTAQDVTGMSFAPEANAWYEIEGQLMVRADTAATAAPRPGVGWPTGGADGVAALQMSGGTGFAATTPVYGDITNPVELATVDVANTTQSFPCQVKATLIMGASPGGSFRITLKSETAASNVTMRAGSWFKYRRIR